jgi:hypothetical protein
MTKVISARPKAFPRDAAKADILAMTGVGVVLRFENVLKCGWLHGGFTVGD